MRLAYIDENKFSPTEPFFYIGGAIFCDTDLAKTGVGKNRGQVALFPPGKGDRAITTT